MKLAVAYWLWVTAVFSLRGGWISQQTWCFSLTTEFVCVCVSVSDQELLSLQLLCFLGHMQQSKSVKDTCTENCILMLLDMFFHTFACIFVKFANRNTSHVFAPSMHFRCTSLSNSSIYMSIFCTHCFSEITIFTLLFPCCYFHTVPIYFDEFTSVMPYTVSIFPLFFSHPGRPCC